jgi:aryl-alcohol dehydrogenase-like predicted oxidoreductase/predicted kinase/histidinol phosphatase-like enzyme
VVETIRIALGCMRLSTERDRDEPAPSPVEGSRATAVLHAAFDAGLSLFDTADAYCLDDQDRGHNERLIARALATWNGDRSTVRIATKGGVTRPQGRWEPDGRAKHLRAACEASLNALGGRIHLYQLHAPDPQVPLATSVRALAGLQRAGLVDAIGLCNVTVGQIEESRRIADIAAVQVELSVWHEHNVLGGVVPYCIREGISLLAYRPLGGVGRRHRTAKEPTLLEIATRHGATPAEVALAWLLDLSDRIIPVPGATRVESVASIARARQIVLTDEDRAQLDRRFPAGPALRCAPTSSRAGPAATGEIVLIMGLPGAGKSTIARDLTAQGFHRLNRDEVGGTLRDLLPVLDRTIASGTTRIVLDNTYVSRRSRAEVLRAAAQRGLPVRCVWLTSSVDDAQVNAASRIVSSYGRLPDEAELKALARHDPAAFPPAVQFRYHRELEPPDPSEGFSRIDTIRFERGADPAFVNRALIVWCDGVLIGSASGRRMPLEPGDVEVPEHCAAVLHRYAHDGWKILGLSWQPEIADGTQSPEGARAVFDRMRELLRLEIDVEYCPHAAGPPRCWCRKPLPGLGVLLVHRHRLDPARCIYIGSGAQDPGFARKVGFAYSPAEEFFAGIEKDPV